MRYQVPQFIEIEDKIFGPLTIKQFIYLAGAGGLCLIFFTLLPLYITVILSIPVLGFGAGLAFYTVNDRPLIIALEHASSYLFGTKLYLWKRGQIKSAPAPITQSAPGTTPLSVVPKLTESKLRDLAWSLNIKEQEGTRAGPPEGLAL